MGQRWLSVAGGKGGSDEGRARLGIWGQHDSSGWPRRRRWSGRKEGADLRKVLVVGRRGGHLDNALRVASSQSPQAIISSPPVGPAEFPLWFSFFPGKSIPCLSPALFPSPRLQLPCAGGDLLSLLLAPGPQAICVAKSYWLWGL